MAFVPPARHLLRAKDLADARYFESLEVEDMAAAAGLSKAHFSREFRRAFGDSPHAYLLTRRLERAAAMLRSTDRSVADICLSVGLLSIGSFTTSFTRTFGVPPRRLPSRPSARLARGDRPRLRGASLRPPATPHVSRRQRAGLRLASPATLRFDQRETTIMRIAHAQLWVHDQDEALAFYTEKVGMEVRADATLPEMGDFRWLTVGPPGQEDVSIVLMAIPGPPVMDEETADQVRELMAKGFAGTAFLTTDDCQASYEEMKARGVVFTETPEERPYGVDAGFRDPSGNSLRLTEVHMPAEV
jgi:AraC-like DNA-binding protein/catechol 2,3-dioxygenase-like lactoylglutathione lyase family enzyme